MDRTWMSGMQRTSGSGAEVGSPRPRRMRPRPTGVPLSRMQPIGPSAAQPFRGLTPDEHAYLQNWHKLAAMVGIDSVEDLMSRPWPCPVADAIIGVYSFGEEMAKWMVIGQDGIWVVACCSDGTVSKQFDSLEGALSYLQPVEDVA